MRQNKKVHQGWTVTKVALLTLGVAFLLLQNPLTNFVLERFGKTTQGVLISEEVKETRVGSSTLMYEFFAEGSYYKGVSGVVDPYNKRVGEEITVRYLKGWPGINSVQ